MAVNDVYRLSVDYTLGTQVTSPTSGKTAFVPFVQLYSSGGGNSVAITSPLGTQAIAASVAVTPATSSVWPASQSGTWNITNISGTISLPTGASTEATLLAVSGKLPASLGAKVPTASFSVISAVLENETVAASQTAQVLGGSGATGDYLGYIVITPANTSPGTVIILDNATPIFTFTGGASSVPSLVPIIVPFGTLSASGAWKCTTGVDVAVTAFGDFTA